MQDINNNMLHLHVAQQLPSHSKFMHQWYISDTNDNNAQLKRQFPLSIDLNRLFL